MNQTGERKSGQEVIAAGARVAIRDAEWLVRKVDRSSHGSLAVSCVGLSELVKNKESVFLSDLDVNKVMRSIEAAEELYYRLVLVVGKSGTGKTSVMQKLADRHNTELININLCLSKELLELTEKQRQLKLTEILSGIVDCTNKVVFLDNTEVLFDVELKQDPLRLLQGLSRNLIVVASWNGSFNNGKLTYAEPGHREYRKYDSIDALVVGMNGETTADFSQ